jgi:hypothetical protein
MKKTVSYLLVAFVLCALTSVAVFAKEKSRVITFGQDFVVGESSVKAGTYKVTYDDKTNELTFADRKSKEVVAKAKATTQSCEKTSALDLKFTNSSGKNALVSITFAGDNVAIVVGGNGSGSASGLGNQ